jgi:hypothetical protein
MAVPDTDGTSPNHRAVKLHVIISKNNIDILVGYTYSTYLCGIIYKS